MIDLNKYKELTMQSLWTYTGQVTKVVGLAIESTGPKVNVGDICIIQSNKQGEIFAEVVGFNKENILLMPLGDTEGIGPGCKVLSFGEKLSVQAGEELLGKVVDWQGKPINQEQIFCSQKVSIQNEAPNPLTRKLIREQITLGVKAIDGMLSIGKGQRMGIFAGSGVGKSTLMGMIARNALSDINIIALIGERGREVREFIENDLKAEGLRRSIVIVATSDQPALMRLKAAMTATAIAEYFREQGKDVLLMMDSLTRFSMAQREIGLAVGEPPVSKGYPPSVFAILPKLLERAGNSDKGSITGLYTVLVDGDDFNEPITDTVRGIVDGHILLSRKLAHKGHYPAIDVLGSISRVMGAVTSKEHVQMAMEMKKHLAVYTEAEDLINVGAYQKGSSQEIDEAIERIGPIRKFLQQTTEEAFSLEDTLAKMNEALHK
jgi:flagellum-specific ATP synthase